jgi:hypothetical protein
VFSIVGGQVDHGNLCNVVGGTTDSGAQSTKTDRGRLRDNSIGNGSACAGENEGDEDTQNGLGIVRRRALVDRGADAKNDKQSDVGGCAPEINSSTTEPSRQTPGACVGHKLKTRIDQVELERFIRGDSSFYVGVSHVFR